MKCPKCNTKNAENAQFCQSCGAQLTSNSAQTAAPSADFKVNNKKKGGCLKPVLIGIGIILGLFLLIGIFSSKNSNSPNTTAQQTESKAKTPEEIAKELEQYKSECQTIPYQELARNPKNYENQKVVFTGKVIQVMESGSDVTYRVNVTKSQYGYDDTVYVTYKRGKDETRVLENDIVQFWGEAKGLKTYQSTMGGQITIPQVNAKAIALAK